MFETTPSATMDVTLEDVLARLKTSPLVDGLMLVGSGAVGLNPDSDIDLIVLVTEHPVPQRYGCTWIERRFTDIGFMSTVEADEMTEGRPSVTLTADDRYYRIRMMLAGDIRFDRSGRLAGTVAALRSRPYRFEVSDEDIFRRWDHANYNVSQSERYAASQSPLYQRAFDLRMTYQLADIMVDYFIVRRMPWPGEKGAIQYWEREDEKFLSLFFDCLRERDAPKRFDLYRQLVETALGPVGGLWPEHSTSWSPFTGQATPLWLRLLEGA